mmetsp:Transcript_26316/g.81279  ORF Transcript_26316/g.81279 Transcript_26316/m.81279 type:complete len:240 (-) Transcript_26316:5387-6106(-)
MLAPNLSTSSNMSRMPPEKPRQLARMKHGRRSWWKSSSASAVLRALSGNQTWPACASTAAELSGSAGSAGSYLRTLRVSTMMTPAGMPPRVARPTTTVLAQSESDSTHEPASNMPSVPVAASPATRARGSYGAALAGTKVTSRSTGSAAGCDTRRGTAALAEATVCGMRSSQRSAVRTASRSSRAWKCDTPFGSMISVPPSCWLDEYTSLPSSLLMAGAPVRMIGELLVCTTRRPRRTR